MSEKRKMILLVDPDPDVRQMLEGLAGKENLLVAKDFVKGRELYEENRRELCLVVARAKINGMSAEVFVSLVRQVGSGFEPILVNSGDPAANVAMVGPKMATHATNGTNLVPLVAQILGL